MSLFELAAIYTNVLKKREKVHQENFIHSLEMELWSI